MTDVPMDEGSGEPMTPDDAAIGGVPTSAEGSLATDSGLVETDETSDEEAGEATGDEVDTDEAGSGEAGSTGGEATGDEVDTATSGPSGESPVERGL